MSIVKSNSTRTLEDFILPIAYALLAVVFLLSLIAYEAGAMWPTYTAAVLYTATLLAYVLPATATSVNRLNNIGGTVAALVLTLVVTPAVFAAGASMAVASSVANSIEDVVSPVTEEGEGWGTMFDEDGADYSWASTEGDCYEVWMDDFSDSADADYDDCLDRVG